MNRCKYFKVKRFVLANGRIVYKVEGYHSWIDMFLGFGILYKMENETMEDAIEQIDEIVRNKIVDESDVYKRNV